MDFFEVACGDGPQGFRSGAAAAAPAAAPTVAANFVEAALGNPIDRNPPRF